MSCRGGGGGGGAAATLGKEGSSEVYPSRGPSHLTMGDVSHDGICLGGGSLEEAVSPRSFFHFNGLSPSHTGGRSATAVHANLRGGEMPRALLAVPMV